MTDILIVPVGLEVDRIIFSPQFVPVNEIYLLKDRDVSDNGKGELVRKNETLIRFTNDFYNEVKKTWEPIYEQKIHTEIIDLTDQNQVIDALASIIIKEAAKSIGTTFYINISTATKLFGIIACHVASFLPGRIIPFYLSTSNYILPDLLIPDESKEDKRKFGDFSKHGLTTGPYKFVGIPVMPIARPKEIGFDILQALMALEKQGKGANLTGLLSMMEGSQKEPNYRIKTSFWAKKLRDLNFITMVKKGRDYQIEITSTGKLIYKLSKALEPLNI